MSKKREYRNYPSTDAPQQKPGTTRQALAENHRIESEFRARQQTKRHHYPGGQGPALIGGVEIP